MNTSMRTTSTTAVVSLVLGVLCWSVLLGRIEAVDWEPGMSSPAVAP